MDIETRSQQFLSLESYETTGLRVLPESHIPFFTISWLRLGLTKGRKKALRLMDIREKKNQQRQEQDTSLFYIKRSLDGGCLVLGW